jgi:arylsulfatase A-like enzyme
MSRRARLLAVALALLGACARRPAPNVLLIVVDTLRADGVGWVSGKPDVTPFLDSLAERAFVFRNAYAASSWTDPSVASLLTSRYASQHGVSTLLAVLAERERTLAEVLRKHGWATGGFSANSLLAAELGYDQGFEHWDSFPPGKATASTEPKERADRLNAKALAWLDGVGHGRPVFLYLQYMEPHFPYDPPGEYRRKALAGTGDAAAAERTLADMMAHAERWSLTDDPEAIRIARALYDGEVTSLDARLREMFDALRARGFLDDAIVVVTADHGEEFGDHGHNGHGRTLYQEVIHVPLLVLLPGQTRGARIDEVASLVDVAPTLLDLVGILRPATVEGRSLASLVRPPSLFRRATGVVEWLAGHRGPSMPAAYAQIVSDSSGGPLDHHHATIVGSRKLIVHADGTLEAYDLAADPGEHASDPALGRLAEVQQATDELERRAARDPSPYMAAAAPDDATTARMRALGYVH